MKYLISKEQVSRDACFKTNGRITMLDEAKLEEVKKEALSEFIDGYFDGLNEWTLDDDGHTVYEDEEGEEKYPGFDLYAIIARTVHDAVPREQVRKPVFEQFLWKGDVPKTVYSLGC